MRTLDLGQGRLGIPPLCKNKEEALRLRNLSAGFCRVEPIHIGIKGKLDGWLPPLYCWHRITRRGEISYFRCCYCDARLQMQTVEERIASDIS